MLTLLSKKDHRFRDVDPSRYVYTENGSKNNSGSNLRVENKVVPVYANPISGTRCLVYLLDDYFSKLPKYAFEKDVRPKQGSPPFSVWYESVPVEVAENGMCSRAGCVQEQELLSEKLTILLGLQTSALIKNEYLHIFFKNP